MADEIDLEDDPDVAAEAEEIEAPDTRSEDLTEKKGVKDYLLKVFADVEEGFNNQQERVNAILDYWDIYNCKLNSNQFYNGTSQIYVPIVYNAVNARKTRFTNQIFPLSGRNIEVTSSDATLPSAITALMESHVRKSKLRTKVMPALVKNGDIEGQYNIYVDWQALKRFVTTRVNRPLEAEGDLVDPAEDVEDVEEIEVTDEFPAVEVLSDADVLVLPQTADTVDEALEAGGSATVLRRWGKAKIRKLIREKLIDKEVGTDLLKEMAKDESISSQRNVRQENVDAAGIKEGDIKHALIYETWLKLKVDGVWRTCVAYFGGDERILGCRLNPNWSDRLPLISHAVEKISGVFKGRSKVEPCATLQYAANDAINEGMDSAAYALLPNIMTDPEKNPRVGSMVLATAAIWETSPEDTQFAQFPQLWKEAFQIVGAAKAQIAETLGVSPAAITQQASEKRLSQAEIASEQQVDILSTADATTVIEEGVLNPLLIMFAELDHQHRDVKTLVRSYGQLGQKAVMEEIEPLQMDKRYQFRWFGVEAARNAQQIQQQIAGMNIITAMPPQMYPGYKLNMAPLIVQLTENIFGPRLAPLVFEDTRSQLSVSAQQENMMLAEGLEAMVHPMDNDAEHMQIHLQALQGGDQHGTIRAHLQQHQQAMQMKATAAAMQQAQASAMGQQQPGQPGAPAPSKPGLRPGAQPGTNRGGSQNPAGSFHQDEMIDPHRAPRLRSM